MSILLFIVAILLLFIGVVYLYQPSWVVRINKIARERIFNDTIVLLERRKRAVFFILVSFLFFYLGYYFSQYSQNALAEKLISNDRLLYQSLQHLNAREYGTAKMLSEKILARDPNNAQALYILGAAEYSLNDPAAGKNAWLKAVKIAPLSPETNHIKDLIAKGKSFDQDIIK